MKLSVMATVWDRDQRQGPRNYPLVKPLGKDTRCNPPVNLVQGIATSWHNSWYCYPHRPPAGMTVPCPNIFNIFFSYLRELKLSLTILCVKVGQNTCYFICNSSGQNLHMHFKESLSIEWVLRLMFWKKAVTWTTMNIAILITNNHTLACISVKCLQMDLYHHNPWSTLKGI